jgi:hypothetical protein
MRAAVVDLATKIVVNIIVADALYDRAPDGCMLLDIEHMECDIGWTYDAIMVDFIPPLTIEEGSDGI